MYLALAKLLQKYNVFEYTGGRYRSLEPRRQQRSQGRTDESRILPPPMTDERAPVGGGSGDGIIGRRRGIISSGVGAGRKSLRRTTGVARGRDIESVKQRAAWNAAPRDFLIPDSPTYRRCGTCAT